MGIPERFTNYATPRENSKGFLSGSWNIENQLYTDNSSKGHTLLTFRNQFFCLMCALLQFATLPCCLQGECCLHYDVANVATICLVISFTGLLAVLPQFATFCPTSRGRPARCPPRSAQPFVCVSMISVHFHSLRNLFSRIFV